MRRRSNRCGCGRSPSHRRPSWPRHRRCVKPFTQHTTHTCIHTQRTTHNSHSTRPQTQHDTYHTHAHTHTHKQPYIFGTHQCTHRLHITLHAFKCLEVLTQLKEPSAPLSPRGSVVPHEELPTGRPASVAIRTSSCVLGCDRVMYGAVYDICCVSCVWMCTTQCVVCMTLCDCETYLPLCVCVVCMCAPARRSPPSSQAAARLPSPS